MTNGNSPQSSFGELELIDDAEGDETVPLENYAISSFGIDFDVEGLVRRLNKGDIIIPDFQRNYVWNQSEASLLIESLLLGLPVPGIFLAKEGDSQRLLIIDGQQRLKTLEFFYKGFFKPKPNEAKKKVFDLINVQDKFKGKTYESLSAEDRRILDNSVIHATVIKQELPDEDEDTSLFYIFGRLNSTGRKLTGQEIRTAIYHGPLIDLVNELNQDSNWRSIFGKENERLKDRELILRVLALYFYGKERYERPMENYLNRFCAKYQRASDAILQEYKSVFLSTISIANQYLGPSAFRPVRGINVAVLDAIFVGLAVRLSKGPIENPETLMDAHKKLVADAYFNDATSKSTADETNVLLRIKLAESAFAGVV